MTREEDIKENMTIYDVTYTEDGDFVTRANEDMLYLFARNEKLQQRVELLETLADVVRQRPRGVRFAFCEWEQALGEALVRIDAKEQVDD